MGVETVCYVLRWKKNKNKNKLKNVNKFSQQTSDDSLGYNGRSTNYTVMCVGHNEHKKRNGNDTLSLCTAQKPTGEDAILHMREN